MNSYSKQLDIEELSKFVKNSALQISKELRLCRRKDMKGKSLWRLKLKKEKIKENEWMV